MSLVHAASFRDPSGFVFLKGDAIYRQVNAGYAEHYDKLMESGLYKSLVADGALVPHVEVAAEPGDFPAPGGWKLLQPEPIPFVSYPYEWSFGMWQDAARATLDILKRALAHGMWLKDASAFNIQFVGSRPVLIDTLSFEIYPDGAPWPGYRQFCQHSLAPLALMAQVDIRLGDLMRQQVDGVPLDLAVRLLPARSRLNPHLLAHLHLHASQQRRHADTRSSAAPAPTPRLEKGALLALIDSLDAAVAGLRWEPRGTEWADYYGATNYTDAAQKAKVDLVGELLDAIAPTPRRAWDLGANTGRFSRLAAERGMHTVAWDIDPAAVESLWRACRAEREPNLLPLRLDLANPTPDLGWELQERDSFLRRGPVDVVLALALIHHLAIGNNVPLPQVARLLARAGGHAIVEWVPREDSQVQRLLRGRRDIFDRYTQADFEAALTPWWRIVRVAPIPETQRTLYLLARETSP